MSPSDFASEVTKYWSKVADNPEVARAILEEINKAPAPALKAILTHMKHSIKPSYMVGVSDIVEAARLTGSVLKPYQSRIFEVTCPGCQSKYVYQQGAKDVCPTCEFPYMEHIVVMQYRHETDSGRVPPGILSCYHGLLDKAQKTLARVTANDSV